MTRVSFDHLPQLWSHELLCLGMERLERNAWLLYKAPFAFQQPASIVNLTATRLTSSPVLSGSQD